MSPEQRIAKHNLQPYLALIDPDWAHLNQFDYHSAIEAAERVRAAIMAEREACAKVASDYAETIETYPWVKTATDIAASIRARCGTIL